MPAVCGRLFSTGQVQLEVQEAQDSGLPLSEIKDEAHVLRITGNSSSMISRVKLKRREWPNTLWRGKARWSLHLVFFFWYHVHQCNRLVLFLTLLFGARVPLLFVSGVLRAALLLPPILPHLLSSVFCIGHVGLGTCKSEGGPLCVMDSGVSEADLKQLELAISSGEVDAARALARGLAERHASVHAELDREASSAQLRRSLQATLIKQGFPPARVVQALRRGNAQSVEEATAWLTSQGDP